MTIDIRGVNTHNKGAHLMLLAVVERLGSTLSLSLSPNGSAYDVRSHLGLRQTAVLNQAPLASAILSNRVPQSLADSFGIARDKDITGVLDAAGYAYGDAFSPKRSKRESSIARRWTKRGAKIVALPQAFGPFSNADVKEWSGKYLGQVSLAFARDPQSLAHLREVAPHVESRLSPDFTLGLSPALVERPVAGPFCAIVPNGKIVSHTAMTSEQYVQRLVDAGRAFRAAGVEPVVVIHETGDRRIAQALQEQLSAPLVDDPDPLVLKGVLGQAAFAVASRFHALVGALSQGTPSIAFGWSHKYEALLADFDSSEWMYRPENNITDYVSRILTADDLPLTLAEISGVLKKRNDEMWEMTIETLSGT